MELLSRFTLLLIGVVFHLLFTMSIFDIYFVSPLVHGMRHFSSPHPAPAQRLFLVVGDGLRADKCFDKITHPTTGETDYLAPYIRSKVLKDATFGISHTRMPTESRPGHVALIAGFYEDVAAVAKGWKENPVDFDSVFNQSSHTYSWGSPDILPMFASGASDKDRVDAIMYSSDSEDFTKGSIALDEFVFERVHDLFDRAKTDPELNARLRQEKLVFFLHLLGIDTAGHSYRPYSAEYYDNIKYIDREIEKLEKKVESFYNDGKTAWVFTADHGMSDFGSHGDGHPDNTRTPLVVWGAGVPKPDTSSRGDHDGFSEPWELNSVKRNDVNQADIASLMAYLVGVNYPANSVGELPLEYIDAPIDVKCGALEANAYSISEQYLVKESQRANAEIRFKPFPPLSGDGLSVADRRDRIASLIENKDYLTAIDECEELMSLSLSGLRYLQTYNWLFMRTLVTFGFLGWIGYATTCFLHLYIVEKDDRPKKKVAVRLFPAVTLAVLCAVLYKLQSPLHHYMYAIFPVYFWDIILMHSRTFRLGISTLISRQPGRKPVASIIAIVIFGVALLESIVWGYFDRRVFSFCFAVATMWPWIQNASVASWNWKLSLAWAFLCLVLAVFTLLPVIKEESINQIMAGGALMVLGGLYYSWSLARKLKLTVFPLVLLGVQLGLIALCMAVTRSSIISLQARQGLPLGNQIVGWAVVILSLTVPFLYSFAAIPDYRFRLLVVFLAFGPTFVILSISSEGLFYVAFCALLTVWVELEYLFFHNYHKSDKEPARRLSISEFRLSLFFFFLTQIAFFGTGNIASISSFFLDSVVRLVPIFDPFSMGAILIFKILVPFAYLSMSLGILNLRLGVPKSALFTMVLCISDILTLNFFYLVVDEGSWLDIGTGISHFCVVNGLCVFMLLLEYLSEVLVRGVVIKQKTT